MAEIVLGMGVSHGPLLTTPPEQWNLRAQADKQNKSHWFRGKSYDYEALLAARAPGFASQVEIEVCRERFARSRAAMAAMSAKFASVAPEAIVVLGNDQREFFGPDLTPPITIYRGAEIHNVQHLHESSPGLNIAEPGNAPSEGATHPGAPDLADHILESLREDGFDLAQSDATPVGSKRGGIPHAYGFIYHSILGDNPPPSVPVILNVHFAHNVPRNRRCLDLGRAMAKAIQSFEGYKTVAMIASGGMSHFVVDEDLDHRLLKAMEAGDEDALAAVPENYFKVGTAETKNWYPVIAAMNAAGKKFHLLDYVPCYRSEAGTGCAMGFVYWE